jgi:DNA-binding MarR family transcriptional regulator
MGANHELKNRCLHIDYKESVKSAKPLFSKCQNCTLEELALLREINQNPFITQKELAVVIGKSERTVKSKTVELQEKGLLRRKNGKRNGQWEVLIEI